MALLFAPNKSKAQSKVDLNFWTQAWYQHVENGKGDNGLNDFMLRRGYLSVKGQPIEHLSFFTHIAVDRLVNYYLKGHNAKASLDFTMVNYLEADSQGIFTVQLAVGI